MFALALRFGVVAPFLGHAMARFASDPRTARGSLNYNQFIQKLLPKTRPLLF